MGRAGNHGGPDAMKINKSQPALPAPSRVLMPMGLAVCLSLFGDLSLFASLVTRADVLGLSLGAVGIMLSVHRLIRIPGNPLGGALLDRWGRRRLFILGMALATISTAAYGLVRGF
jgi:MFS family permease